MTSHTSELPAARPESVGDNLAGMPSFYIDPEGAARRVHTKWFWVGPLVLISIAGFILGTLFLPILQHVMEITPVPANITPEQYQKRIAIGLTIQKVLLVYLAPVLAVLVFSIKTGILLATSSVMGVKATFRQLFNLVSGCALISLLEQIAAIVILKAKGDISSVAELRPPMGIDIFLPESTNKILLAFLGYFSIFQLWWIVMVVLILAVAFRVSKGKAFAVVSPVILLGLAWQVLTTGFQR
jgi:hypothetical protein